MMLHKEKYITVTDDWHPNFNGNQVKIILSLNYFNNYYYVKLMAWGADDTAYEIEKDNLTIDEALHYYNNELTDFYESIPNGIDKEWFIEHGFERF